MGREHAGAIACMVQSYCMCEGVDTYMQLAVLGSVNQTTLGDMHPRAHTTHTWDLSLLGLSWSDLHRVPRTALPACDTCWYCVPQYYVRDRARGL